MASVHPNTSRETREGGFEHVEAAPLDVEGIGGDPAALALAAPARRTDTRQRHSRGQRRGVGKPATGRERYADSIGLKNLASVSSFGLGVNQETTTRVTSELATITTTGITS